MAAERSPKPEPSAEGKRRLTLMESYDPDRSAFSNTNLSGIADSIRTIAEPNKGISPRGEIPSEIRDESHSETPGIPSGQIVRPLFDSPSISPREEATKSPGISPSLTPTGSSLDSPSISSHGEILFLTSNQALLYECAKILNGHFTTLARVSRTVNVSVDTLRSCLRKLRRIGALDWSAENISGQNGMRISATDKPYTVRGTRSALDSKLANLDHSQLALNSSTYQVDHQVFHQPSHQVDHQISCSSSNQDLKKLQLQDLDFLILEGTFEDLNPSSLLPFLDQFENLSDLQDFLDMTTAVINDQVGSSKPIKNPPGFLFAQLRQGFVNPPPGFKSRRLLAQESNTARKKAELAERQRLLEEATEAEFELYKMDLSGERRTELEATVAERVKPGGPVSRERQVEVYRDEVLREWFEERGA